MMSSDTQRSQPAAGSPAPVVVFAFNRRAHLERTLSSLLANPEAATTHVHIYCDGSRTPADDAAVADVRGYVQRLSGFASITRVLRDKNLGLARSIIEGVTQLLATHDRVVVMEDDLVVSPHFLRYMNDALECYRDDERVASIHGYCYPVAQALPETFFLKGADCWGWATWPRAWRHFEHDGRTLLAQLRSRQLCREFDFDDRFPYTRMLEDQIAGRNNSWAIRWHASCYLKNLLTLYPGRSLVENIGHDSSGTHCGHHATMGSAATQKPVAVGTAPVEPSAAARASFVAFFGSQLSLKQRLRLALRRVIQLTQYRGRVLERQP
jgi:hypothetical protein